MEETLSSRSLKEPSSRIGAITSFATSEILMRMPGLSPEETAKVVAEALKECAKFEEGEKIEACVFDVVRKAEAELRRKRPR